ncbi:hypothetical protein F2Q68_00037504 [Brassica cretica]|uniref:RING-type E3 ubiquitin transferase n=1 Tax=Brassica cretica TaxID=69181 RepID=A0A8S9HAR7_BRACR|nr:hypothetical protein F2Q68_00037504 [Brassica cretica]
MRSSLPVSTQQKMANDDRKKPPKKKGRLTPMRASLPVSNPCQNGHTFCSTCKVRVHNRCPTCRQELGDIRCLALEKVAESLELPCKYFNLGCPEIFPYYSKLKHESVCNFRPYGCPYTLAPSVLGMGPVYMAFLRFMGDEEEARRYSYSLEVGGSGRKLTWEGTPRSIRDSHRKVRDSNDGLIIERNMALFFSGGDRKELKLRVTGKIWKELHSADSGLTKSKHTCGICKKISNHLDRQTWVKCDGCKVWVHAECDKTSDKHLKGLGETDYYCPTCRAKFNFELSDSEKPDSKSKLGKGDGGMVLPDKVIVVCSGVEGIYFPSLHLVVCKCGSCGPQKKQLSEWEKHTGSKVRNWKTSVKVKSSKLPLEEWMMKLGELHANATAANVPKRPSIKQRKQKLRAFLSVHQECYGARHIHDFTSWVCKACQKPSIKRDCCLCPVKGGALKPTDVETLWVHVTCAWFQPEVCFASDEKMEPAVGILSIPSSNFVKICVICKQIHGSCTQCCKCSTYYHAMCASRAGYRMEVCRGVSGLSSFPQTTLI